MARSAGSLAMRAISAVSARNPRQSRQVGGPARSGLIEWPCELRDAEDVGLETASGTHSHSAAVHAELAQWDAVSRVIASSTSRA